MAEYTYADVIIDPEDPRVEIGKEYYWGDTAISTIDRANNKKASLPLFSVDKGRTRTAPFYFCKGDLSGHAACIIRKKEPEKKYVPFDFDDFTVRRDLMGKTIINNYGLDGEGEFREVMIVGFLNKSDEDADCWSSNGDTKGTIAMTIDGWFYADELLKKCTFVDGSPCGVLVEEE